VLAVLVVSGIARGWLAVEAGSFYDERYSTTNLETLLGEGSWRPANTYYPRLSYLPQAALLEGIRLAGRAIGATGTEPIVDGHLTARALLVCRWLVVAYAVASLLVVFLLMLRWFPPAVALLTMVLLGAGRTHYRLSANFKPDMLVLLLSVVALWVIAIALERRTPRWYLASGVAGGLAAAAKLTGGVALLPLGLATLARARRDRGALFWLLAAALVAGLVFVAINPEIGRIVQAFLSNLQAYSSRQQLHPNRARGAYPRELLGWLLSPGGHGWLLGTLALAGFVGLVEWTLRRKRRGDLPPALVPITLVFPLGFVILYGFASDLFKPNNFLPVLPFTSLAAAWLLVAVWEHGSGWIPAGLRTPIGVALGLLVALLAVAPLRGYLSAEVFRSTWDVALERASQEATRLGSPLSVLSEGGHRSEPRGVAVTPVADLRAAGALLGCSDGELFARTRGEGDGGDLYRERLRLGREIAVEPSLLHAVAGAPLTLVLHPWRVAAVEDLAVAPAGVSLQAHPGGSYSPGDCVSLVIGPRRLLGVAPRLEIDGRQLPLRSLGTKKLAWSSDRVAVSAPPATVSIVLPAGVVAPPGSLRVRLVRWSQTPAEPTSPAPASAE
jgi:hypothetical protein